MTSIKQLSKQINIDPKEIYRIIRRDNLITQEQDRLRVYLTDLQCEYITRIMFFNGKCDFIILESKMNTPEPQETFNEFKERTYKKAS
jgi:hypothetical protein